MQILKVDSRNFSEAVAKAVEILRKGGVVAHSTDTVWGLAGDAANLKAIKKIHLLKNSDSTKPLLLNLPSKSYLGKIGSRLCRAKILAKKFWPGGLSLLVRAKNGEGKIGVRIPNHKLSNLLAKRFGRPLVTTSANLSGKKVARNAAEVARIFSEVDLILDDGSISKNSPSTLVDVSEKEIQLIREGEILFKKIVRVLVRHS